MVFVLLLVIIFLVAGLSYFTGKLEVLEKKDKKNKKSISRVENIIMTKEDEKLISSIFNKKIKRAFFEKGKINHSFLYIKNEYSFAGCNSNFDIIKADINKLTINDEIFFNIEFKGWKKLLDYKTDQEPNVEITNIVSTPDKLKNEVEREVKQLFKKINNELESEIEIQNT